MLIQAGGYIRVAPDATATATITASGGGTTRPDLVLINYDATVESRTTTTDLLGGGSLVLLAEGRARSGTLNLLYLQDGLALAALTLHQKIGTCALVETARPIANMTYVSMGATLTLNDDHSWTLSVRFQEVRP